MDQEIDYRSGERFNDNLIEYPGFPEIEALLKQDRAARFDRDQPDEVEQGLPQDDQVRRIVLPVTDEESAKEQLLEALLSDPVMAQAAQRVLGQSRTPTTSPGAGREDEHHHTKEQ